MSEVLELSELNVEIERACRQVEGKLNGDVPKEEALNTSITELHNEKRLHEKR